LHDTEQSQPLPDRQHRDLDARVTSLRHIDGLPCPSPRRRLLNPGRLHTEADSCRYPPFAELFKGNPRMEQFLHENPALVPDFQELDAKRREHWLAEAERALHSNDKTFGVLTVDDMLGKGSLVAVLESRGYRVEVYATRGQ
jgi:hypothetical protein